MTTKFQDFLIIMQYLPQEKQEKYADRIMSAVVVGVRGLAISVPVGLMFGIIKAIKVFL